MTAAPLAAMGLSEKYLSLERSKNHENLDCCHRACSYNGNY